MRKLLLFLLLASPAFGQLWTGIIDPTRAPAENTSGGWVNAGVVGGVETMRTARTVICTTLSPGVSAATINSALSSCAGSHTSDAGGMVLLNSGVYNLTSGINMQRNVTLKGGGATLAVLSFSGGGTGNCSTRICFEGDNTFGGTGGSNNGNIQPGASQACTWTAGFTRGTTSITLTNCGSGGVHNAQYIYLDQADVNTMAGLNVATCSNTTTPCSLEGPNGGRFVGSTAHQQIQIVKVTSGCSSACTGAGPFTLTISPGLYIDFTNTGQGAWFSNNVLQFAGLENLTVDDTNNSSGNGNIALYNACNNWVTGVMSLNANRAHIQYANACHNTVYNDYLYGTKGAQSQSYGVESYMGSDNLTINNIAQRVATPWMGQVATGNVFLYNFDVLDYYCPGSGGTQCNDANNSQNTMGQTTWMHNAGMLLNLWEGNITPGLKGDVFHGSGGLQTAFRNQVPGYAPYVGTRGTVSFELESYNRGYNIIGNVLGRGGFTTSYQNGAGAKVYDLGSGNTENTVTVPSDSGVASTLFRWANVDPVTGYTLTRYCGNSSNTNWGAVCGGTSEVPSGIGTYANAVPASESIPNSFYYASKPSFFSSSKPWPLIGPDVTGGNLGECSGGTYNGMAVTDSSQCVGGGTKVTAYGGHVNSNPAMDCYFQLGGLPDGNGAHLSFSASRCYTNTPAVQPPSSPATGLFAKLGGK